MGTSYTPTYVLKVREYRLSAGKWADHVSTLGEWVVRRRLRDGNQKHVHGAITVKAIMREVQAYVKSFRKGGANEHLMAHGVPNVVEAWVVNQKTRTVVARWKAPAFQVWE